MSGFNDATQNQIPASYVSAPVPPPKPSAASSTYNRAAPPTPSNSGPEYRRPQELDGTPSLAFNQSAEASRAKIHAIETNWLPETLLNKSTADLHALLQNPSLLASLLENPATTHPSILAAQTSLQPLIDSNLSSAQSLLELESLVNQKRSQTQSRLLSLRALEQQHRSKLVETESALKEFSPGALYKRLAASVTEQEALVQGLEQSWLEESGVASDREVGEIVRRVRENKKTAFLKKERRERWDEGRVGGWR